jgi:hypothetical protein
MAYRVMYATGYTILRAMRIDRFMAHGITHGANPKQRVELSRERVASAGVREREANACNDPQIWATHGCARTDIPTRAARIELVIAYLNTCMSQQRAWNNTQRQSVESARGLWCLTEDHV